MNSTSPISSQHPDILIGQALTLRYKPVDLDVLPLYISLVAASPLILWCMVRRPNWTLLGSVAPVHRGALVRLEFRLLSARHPLVLQPVCLAIAVLLRGMVRCRRPRQNRTHDPISAWCWRCPLPGLPLRS